MARYFATNVRPRSELVPSHDAASGPPEGALLDENERRTLQSYRAPSGIDTLCLDSVPTVRWTEHELAALLEVARTTVEPSVTQAEETGRDRSRESTLPPPGKRPILRKAPAEVVMTEVRAKLRRGG